MLSKAELGERIHALRMARRMTLKEVGKLAELSAPHICEIEQGKTSPTFGALARIAGALGKPVAYLLEEELLPELSISRGGQVPDAAPASPSSPAVATAVKAARSAAATVGATPLTSGILSGRLQVDRLVIEPRSRSALACRRGQEAGVVLSGRVEAHANGEVQALGPGEVVLLRSEESGRLENPGPDAAELLWIRLDAMSD